MVTQWERCLPWLLSALARDPDWELAELKARLVSGRAMLWAGERSAVVTEWAAGPSINCWLAAGDMGEIVSMTPGIEAFARATGCVRATIAGGRIGWLRLLRPLGYALDGQEIAKEL